MKNGNYQVQISDDNLGLKSIIYHRPAAGLLMNFSRGCSSILSIMESIPKMSPISLSGGSGSDGYHSDPDHSDDQKYFKSDSFDCYLFY